ncbi:hypothetical protein BO98_02250 [Candidatus Synechococcus spongiarum LMB bulk10D]|nr:hypothetical protein BO98_02250 [Candidatus Synechococcus spongiarum LMB bulk10D]
MLTVKYSKTLFERDETTLTNVRIYMFFLRAIIIGIFFSTSSKITAGEDINLRSKIWMFQNIPCVSPQDSTDNDVSIKD